MSSQAHEGQTIDSAEDQPRVSGKPLDHLVLGFLSCPQDAARGFLGAALLSDFRARPLEFAYVSPIRPTTLQRILYGKTLSEHVLIDVIAKKIMESNGRRPDVIFVNRPELLGVRRLVQVPVAFLSRPPESGSSGSRLGTITYDTGDHKDDEELVGQIVAHLEPLIDMIEPFDRIQEALKEAIKAAATQA